ncbi:MAG TPA: glycosyltransferase family 39 protein [Anaerolineae bacterium]|nr:glycosyltransferase family 39 protein [Anaerolineae bacterium]
MNTDPVSNRLRRDRPALRHAVGQVWIVLFLALIIRLVAALPQSQPNYMDATYYTVGGQRLAQGYGFNDPYVWNYLDQPTTLPHPSHVYWMPLASMLVGISESIFGISYRAAQIPFIVLSALLSLIAFSVAWRLSSSRRAAWIAALLTIFSGFYVPYWGVPESFAPFAVFGSLALYLSVDRTARRLFLAGLCAGLAHLSRADGVLLLIPMLWIQFRDEGGAMKDEKRQSYRFRPDLSPLIFIFMGYFLIMLPWFIRNSVAIGAPLSAAGTQAAYVCNYDELFSFNAQLDLNHLINCGAGQVLLDKLTGLGTNLIHLMAEDGLIFLAPLIAIGVWKLRRERVYQAVIIYLVLLYLVMSIIFTFAGERGGLFHSSSALLPFFFAAVPIGLDAIIDRIAARRRTWNARQARSIFGSFIVILAVALSVSLWFGRVIGANVADPIWNQADRVYDSIGQWLTDQGEHDPIVMVNNPPSFYYHTGLRSIVIPAGDVNPLLLAADQFGAGWLVLDPNHVHALDALYAGSEINPRLEHVNDFASIQVYRIVH